VKALRESPMTHPIKPKKPRVVPARMFLRMQRRHALLAMVLPHVLLVLLPLVSQVWSGGWAAFGLLFVASTLVGCMGVTVGLHRYFSHRSFKAPREMHRLIGIVSCMAAQGPVTYWVALHRLHHTFSDEPGDPHSPNPRAWKMPDTLSGRLRAFWQGHCGWVWRHDVPMPTRYARDLMSDPVMAWVDRRYPVWVLLSVLIPTAFGAWYQGGWSGALWGFYWGAVVRLVIVHHMIWIVNSLSHTWGRRGSDTTDTSRNLWLLALVTFGEGWHNNHHARPTLARMGWNWRQPDPGWWFICSLQRMGLVHSVKG
jgi:stearoyl-CoA desaturase (delta-9 desaturase)